MTKKICLIILISISISCKNKVQNSSNENLQKYVFILYKDKFDPQKKDFIEASIIDTIQSKNDTTAYLFALNAFYKDKVLQRSLSNYGQPKGFLIVDKDNINIKLKLSQRMAEGMEQQVRGEPEVKKMIDEYNRDSLIVDTTHNLNK